MRLVTHLIAYAIIVGTAIVATALAAVSLLVYTEFASSGFALFWVLIFLPALLLVPAVAALAAGHIFYKLFQRHGWVGQGGQWIPLLLAGSAPFVACSVFFAYAGYTSRSAPSPAPYPGSVVEEVWKEIGHGQYDTRIYEYTADVSLAELERHYQVEMPQYCANEWHFTPIVACQGYALCLVAECEIPRPLVKEPQLFTVYLRSMSETQTNVQYHIRNESSF